MTLRCRSPASRSRKLKPCRDAADARALDLAPVLDDLLATDGLRALY